MPLQKGDRIGAYEIVATLGQGGMATVYKAYHERLNRFVAIKMIHQAYLEDPSYLARFEREAQIIAALEHPHIVPVYDYSEYNGEPYLVMKLIEGSTLKALLSHDQLLPTDDILAIAAPIADALDYAHSRGVLHRDIKPSNIILDRKSTPYLTDFGLARLTISGATTLSQDLMIGTPFYMSPEQALGKGEIDFRADLYSFGVVLYELLVGVVPFSEGTPYAIINDHVARELPLPHSLNPAITPAVELVLLKALTKDPDDRYTSAAELVEALRGAVKPQPKAKAPPLIQPQPEPAEPPTPSPVTRPGKKTTVMPPQVPKRQSHVVELVLLGIALILILVLVAFVVSRGTPVTPAPTAVVTVAAQQPTLLITLPPAPTEPPPTTLPTQPPSTAAPLSSPPGQNPPPIPLMNVPPLTEQQARDQIARSNRDPVGYLALARVQLQNGDTAGALLTLEQGLPYNPDPIPYEMTAADIAVQAEDYSVAFVLYSGVLEEAQGKPPYTAVRATAGQFLYEAATAVGRLTLAQIRALSTELASNHSPIVSAMIGRAFLSSGMPRLAALSIGSALTADSSLAEAHLVNGEYQQSQGDLEQARTEWQAAASAADAPGWVRERANELLSLTP